MAKQSRKKTRRAEMVKAVKSAKTLAELRAAVAAMTPLERSKLAGVITAATERVIGV